MLRAPIKHFAINIWDAFYFILYLLYAIVMMTVIFHCCRKNFACFFHAEILMFESKPVKRHVFIFDLYNAPES